MSDDVNDLDEILQVLKLKKGHANKQTLKDYDIDSAVERIVNSMKKELGGELRV